MKAYVLISGLIFALVAARHLVTTVQRLHLAGSDPWFVVGPGLILAGTTGLAIWAFRLLRTTKGAD
jgi:hypothetical protein